MKRWIFAVVGLLFICSVAWSDDSAVQGVGGAVAPMKQHPTARMVSERVDIKLGWDGANVKCRFVFKNEGPATIVKMGFPEHAGGDVSPIEKSAYKYFRSWVDGKRVYTRFMPSAKGQEGSYNAWHVKDVYFGAKQTRIIEDEYFGNYGGTSDGSQWFVYILRSGKNWKGSINKAVITFDATDVWSYWRVDPGKEYQEYKQYGMKTIYILRNLEPNKDIQISLRPLFRIYPNDSVKGLAFDIDNKALFGKYGIAMVRFGLDEQMNRLRQTAIKSDQKIRILYGRHSVLLRPGSKIAILDYQSKIYLPVKPYVKRRSIYVLIFTIAKSFGLEIITDRKNGTISMKDPDGMKERRWAIDIIE